MSGKADVIVLTKGGEKVYKCLESLARHSSGSVNVVRVGFNGSDSDRDRLHDYVKELPFQVEIVRQQYNFSQNSTKLAYMSTAEYLLFLNDDVELTEDAVSPCLDVLESDPSVGTVGVKLLFPDGRVQHAGVFVLFRPTPQGTQIGFGHIGINTNGTFPDMVTFGNTAAFMACRRADFERLGGFPKYHVCFEDLELNLRYLLEGKANVTLNTVSAVHDESSTRGKNSIAIGDSQQIHQYIARNLLGLVKAAKDYGIGRKYERRES